MPGLRSVTMCFGFRVLEWTLLLTMIGLPRLCLRREYVDGLIGAGGVPSMYVLFREGVRWPNKFHVLIDMSCDGLSLPPL